MYESSAEMVCEATRALVENRDKPSSTPGIIPSFIFHYSADFGSRPGTRRDLAAAEATGGK